ncbi:glutamyl-tRNA amidotransferase [Phellopilus nigrolimitatus]|nr:glutamyl-tRNA amidotransferase [Phellopilus nigrolimitatus]
MFRRCFRTFQDTEGFFLRSNLSTKASFKSESKWPGWELVVGLEVHAQIKSRAKLFSHAWTSTYDEQANTHVDIFDASFPGTLPKLNSTCVDLALRTAVALNSQIQYHSSFDRKHYFYSDIPSGYQITQYYSPFAKGGQLRLSQNGICVNIKQIQLEQDTAKSTFDPKEQNSVIDLNRAGTALMEIISEPDMKTPEQAGEYVKTLQALLRTVGSSDGNMEEGSLRCDVNVSVNKFGEPRGTRCEIKNLNSVKFMMVAIVSEALRHISLLEAGGIVTQETRGFDEHRAETFPMRSKEDTPDYRYMPDPNLPPLILEDGYVESVRTSVPELPEETRARLIAKRLSTRDVNFLMSIDAGREVGFDGRLGQGFVSFFEDVAEDKDPKVAINWITHDLYGLLIARKETFKDNPVSVVQLRELIGLVESKNITSTSGKQLLKYIVEQRTDRSPIVLAQELSLLALNSSEESFNEIMDEYCLKAIEELPEEAKVVRGGNIKVLNKLVGFVMKMSKGRADAQAVHIRLKNIIMNKED